MDLNPDSEVVVYCDCGAKYKFTGSHMDDSIECGMCGRRVRVKGRKAVPSNTQERTALQAFAERQTGEEDMMAAAVHLVREHRYEEALAQYAAVLNAHPSMRDVFYGMGYCYSRTGEPDRAMALLQLAQACGHATAHDLIKKLTPGRQHTQ